MLLAVESPDCHIDIAICQKFISTSSKHVDILQQNNPRYPIGKEEDLNLRCIKQ